MTYQEAVAVHAAHERVALEDALRVVVVERQERARGLANLGQRHLHAPHLALVAQAKLADELQLGVEALLFERAARLLVGFAV